MQTLEIAGRVTEIVWENRAD